MHTLVPVDGILQLLSSLAGDQLDPTGGAISATQKAFEAGGYGLAAVIFVTFGSALGLIYRAKEKLHADQLLQDKAHAADLEELRKEKDEEIKKMSAATVDMVEKQTKILVEVSMTLQRVERLTPRGPAQ